MILASLFLLTAGLPSRTVTLSPAMLEKPVRLSCPIRQVTRIVFAEHFLAGGVKVSKGATDELGLALETSRPLGVVTVEPPAHPARGTLELRGPTVTLALVLVTVPDGSASEVRFVSRPLEARTNAPSTPAPPPATEPVRVTAGEPAVSPLPLVTLQPFEPPSADAPPGRAPAARPENTSPFSIPDVSPAAAEQPFDLEGLLLARPERIGRREGMPGQPPVVLEDAFRSDRWVWLRFRFPGGARRKVENVSWEHGPIGSLRAQPTGTDLRLVIQVPRALVTKHTRIDIRVLPGGAYTFPVSAPWLSTFIRELF